MDEHLATFNGSAFLCHPAWPDTQAKEAIVKFSAKQVEMQNVCMSMNNSDKVYSRFNGTFTVVLVVLSLLLSHYECYRQTRKRDNTDVITLQVQQLWHC